MTTRQEQHHAARRRRQWEWAAKYGWCVTTTAGLVAAIAWVSPSDANLLAMIFGVVAVVTVVVWAVAVRMAERIGYPVKVAEVVNPTTVTLTASTGQFLSDDVGKEFLFPSDAAVFVFPKRKYPLPATTTVPRQFVDAVANGWVEAPGQLCPSRYRYKSDKAAHCWLTLGHKSLHRAGSFEWTDTDVGAMVPK